MKAEKKQETRVSKAIAEAWEGSTSAKQAADKYVVMLKEDQALRDEATENWLERIAYKDVAMHPVNYRHAFKSSVQKLKVLQKGETSTPSVALTGVVSIYAQDMFERFKGHAARTMRSRKYSMRRCKSACLAMHKLCVKSGQQRKPRVPMMRH